MMKTKVSLMVEGPTTLSVGGRWVIHGWRFDARHLDDFLHLECARINDMRK